MCRQTGEAGGLAVEHNLPSFQDVIVHQPAAGRPEPGVKLRRRKGKFGFVFSGLESHGFDCGSEVFVCVIKLAFFLIQVADGFFLFFYLFTQRFLGFGIFQDVELIVGGFFQLVVDKLVKQTVKFVLVVGRGRHRLIGFVVVFQINRTGAEVSVQNFCFEVKFNIRILFNHRKDL